MTEQTIIAFSKGENVGSVGGSWASPSSSQAASTLHSVRSIGYPIMAASVSIELKTALLIIDIPDAGGLNSLPLQKSLPNTIELAALLNASINETYAGYGGALPQFVQQAEGWFWTNPTPSIITITFPTGNIQQLILGVVDTDDPQRFELSIAPSMQAGPYFPDPRLGAVSQSLLLRPAQSHRIELPLTGPYREGVLFRPTTEIVTLLSPVTTAQIEVSYPSIRTQTIAVADCPSQIRISSAHTQ